MKKILYSALAVATAIAGVAATKANNHNTRVAAHYFKLITGVTPSTQHNVTLTTNWTLTNTPSCVSGSAEVCVLGSNESVFVVGSGSTARHLPTIPAGETITATPVTAGHYKLIIDGDANVDDQQLKN